LGEKTRETVADKAMVIGGLLSVLGLGVLQWLHPDAFGLGILGILMLTGGFIMKTLELTGGSFMKTPSAMFSIFKTHKFLIAGLLIYLIPSFVFLGFLIGDGWFVVLQSVRSFSDIIILINMLFMIPPILLFSPILIYYAVSYGLLLLFYCFRESDQESRPRTLILNPRVRE